MESSSEVETKNQNYGSWVLKEFDTSMIDDDLERIYSYTADTREHMLVTKTKDGVLVGSKAEETRKRIIPNRKDYTGVIVQIVSEFVEDGETKRYLGTGSIQITDDCSKLFIVTWAHNFIQEVEDYDSVELNFSKRSTIYLSRNGKGEFLFKAPILNYVVHPEYLKKPRIHDGFDVAVATFDLKDALPQIKDQDRFKRKLVRIIPLFTNTFVHKQDEKILIIGYPGEKNGYLYEMEGSIHGTKKRKGGTEVIIYRDIDTTCGQSGAPVYKYDDEQDLEIIGIHVGFFKKKKANLATLITQKLKTWIIGWIQGEIPVDREFDTSVSRPKDPLLMKSGSSWDDIIKILQGDSAETVVLDSSYILRLDGNLEKDRKIVQETQNLQFPNYKKLEIKNIEGFDENDEIRTAFLEFLHNATPYSLKYVMISGANHPNISPFIEGLGSLFDVVSDEIYISSFTIGEAELSAIFAKSYKVKRLALIWCYLKISPVFEIDWKIDYMIEELDLFLTWSEYDSKCLDVTRRYYPSIPGRDNFLEKKFINIIPLSLVQINKNISEKIIEKIIVELSLRHLYRPSIWDLS